MWTTPYVVVGVTGAGDNSAAMRFAVDEAQRTDAEVVLVHAIHQIVPPPPPSASLVEQVSWEDVGYRIVSEAQAEFDAMSGGAVASRCVVEKGHPASVLIDQSKGASAVVVSRRHYHPLDRLFTGSTVVAAAAHTHCPVVSVPHEWRSPASAGWVTVGIHEDGTSNAVLEEAFAHAAARGASLRVVHAWRLDTLYDEMVMARLDVDSVVFANARSFMVAGMKQLRENYPSVAVEVQVRHQWPANALVELSADSDLVVVGRHGGHPPLPQRIGHIARAVIHGAECPAVVVPV